MNARRGFTLIEVCTVVGVVGVLAAIAVPSFNELARRSHWNAATRRMVGSLRESRAMAIARPSFGGTRAAVVGIRVDSATRYSQFYDPDSDDTNGNEVTLRTVDLAVDERAPDVRITAPAAGTMLRFRRDGSTTATAFVLIDTESGATRTIRLTTGGQTSLE